MRSVARKGVLGLAMGWAVGLGVLVGGAGTAFAEADSEYVRDGAYVSLAGVYAFQNASGEWKHLNNTGGLHGRFGARVAPPLSLGVFLEWLGYGGKNPAYAGATIKLFPVELLFDTSLLDGVLQPYVVGEFGAIFVSARDGNDTRAGGSIRGGIGVDFYLSEHVALFGETQYSGAGGEPSGIESLNVLAGATWRF